MNCVGMCTKAPDVGRHAGDSEGDIEEAAALWESFGELGRNQQEQEDRMHTAHVGMLVSVK